MSMQNLAQALQSQGRGNDTILAHITPEEAALLKSRGGAGTRNPETGLLEFNFFSDLWRGVKKLAKAAAPFLLPAIAIFAPALIPAIGTTLGASAALAPIVGTMAVSAGITAISGGSLSDIVGSAALAGLGSYLSPILGDYVGDKFGVSSKTLRSMIGSASFSAGLTAVRGGTVNDILLSAASGTLTNYLTSMASNIVNGNKITNMNIKQKTFEEALFAAADAEGLHKAGLDKNEMVKVLTSSGLNSQVSNYVADMASKGVGAEEIATGIANRFSNAHGTKEAPTFYRDGVSKNAAELSISGGANVKALEVIQQLEDASFVYDDAKNLKAAGLKETEIVQNLRAAGVPEALARQAATDAMRGATDGAASTGLLTVADRNKITTFIGEPEGVTTVRGSLPARDLGSEPVKETTAAGKPVASTVNAAKGIMDSYTPSQTPSGDIDADAAFMKADYDQLRAQGISGLQARDTLTAAGVNKAAAQVLFDADRSGWSDSYTTRQLTSTIQRSGGFAGVDYSPAKPAPEPAAAPAAAPVAPVAPEVPTLQSSTDMATGLAAEDAMMVAQDAVNMAQARVPRAQIEANLVAAGVDPAIAKTAAANATSGQSVDAIARNTALLQTQRGIEIFPGYTPPAPVAPAPTVGTQQGGAYRDENGNFRIDIDGVGSIPDTELPPVTVTANPADVTDAEFLAYDAQQLAQQGLGEDAIRQNLIYSGADPFAATQAAAAAFAGADLAAIMAAGTGAAGGENIYTATPPTTPVRNPAQVTDAEFVGFDAEQLAQQGLSQSQIESTLLYSGVDPLVAADAAALATAGYNAATIAQNIEQSGTFVDPVTGNTVTEIFTPGNAPAAALPGYQGPPGSEPGTAVNPTVPVAVQPTPAEAVAPEPEPVAALTPEQAGEIVAADQAGRADVTPAVPARPDMGTFTPASPDPSWSIPLQYPGMNPGLVGAGIRPAYQTTSPVQAQYYYGRQPFFATPDDLNLYGTSPFQPAQPFGIQQGYFEQPLALPQIPVYGENMFVLPQGQDMASRAYGEPLNQPLPVPQPVMPYNMSNMYVLPVAPEAATVGQPQPYVYNIAPRVSQYSIPSAAPVAG